jgi:hypothetical protein
MNGQYESATGETFNAHGKTDIYVKDGEANLFIAECKIWRGPESIKEALDQLFSYLTWRDTKSALIVFSRNRDFSGVLDQLWHLVSEHPQYKRGPSPEGETRMRYVFGRSDDPNREIFLTVMAFAIPQETDQSAQIPQRPPRIALGSMRATAPRPTRIEMCQRSTRCAREGAGSNRSAKYCVSLVTSPSRNSMMLTA